MGSVVKEQEVCPNCGHHLHTGQDGNIGLEALVKEKVRSGRYADESDVIRDALRALEQRDDFDSPALEAALLEGVRSPHRPYGKPALKRIRSNSTA